jgi:hypothetical protein
MNISVVLYFLHNVLATFFLGGKFMSRHNKVLKVFGMALMLDAAAFAAWAYGVVNSQSLLPSVTVGAVLFLASLVFMFNAFFSESSSSTRLFMTIVSILAVGGIFLVGHADPAYATISSEGFLFFNLSPFVQMLYIFALSIASFPLVDLIAVKFKSPYSSLIRYGFIAEIVSGIVLITSRDADVLYITGWLVGVVYVLLWSTLLFGKKAWDGVN